jgi:hypothetical protein
MVIHLNNGTSNPIAYDAMRLFSLKDYTFTSIPPVWQNCNQVLVYQNSENQLVIKSERPVSALNVYDLRGRKMLQLYPGATEFTVSQASLPVGLYIFQIADEQGITVTKFNKIK